MLASSLMERSGLVLEIATVFDFTRDAVILVVGLTAVLASLGVILCSSPIYSA